MPIAAGTPAFQRINRAMLFGGFATFALLYCVQPLMPLLAAHFALTPAQSSWVLSASSMALAISLVFSSSLSERIGRRRLMSGAIVLAALLTLLCCFAQTYAQLLVLRTLLGFALGGMPAVAMAYLSEEIEGSSLGLSMGIYIGGTAFGGMVGRVAASVLSDLLSWRVALGVMGVSGLYAAWEFWRSLPPSQNFRPSGASFVQAARMHLMDPALRWLFLFGFLLMGCFVSLYNYSSYLLMAAPYHLSQSAVGALSVLYVLGAWASVWAGRLADRLGRRQVLWIVIAMMFGGLALTLLPSLVGVLAGMALFTVGFFASHTVASSWVGRRARAPQALASALYLFFYYVGGSVLGSSLGVLWQGGGWHAVVGALALVLTCALAIALRMRGIAPLPEAAVPA
ncbi:MAG: MFS transporter [Pseudomonadota bacterium]